MSILREIERQLIRHRRDAMESMHDTPRLEVIASPELIHHVRAEMQQNTFIMTSVLPYLRIEIQGVPVKENPRLVGIAFATRQLNPAC